MIHYPSKPSGVKVANLVLCLHVLTLTCLAQSGAPAILSVTRDLNGDGRSDLIWRNMVTGDVAVSLTGGSAQIVSRSIVAQGLDLNWQIAGVGDLDGDGKADLVWRNSRSGDVAEWLMDGATVKSYASIASVPDLSWQVSGIGDVDGDGRADLVWRNTGNGNVAEWLMNGASIKSWSALGAGMDAAWLMAGMGDLDGDGKADLIWRSLQTGDVVAWLIDASTIKSSSTISSVPDQAWQIAGIGDLDRDRKSDLIWRNSQNGDVGAWLMNGAFIKSWNTLAVGIDTSWRISEIGDTDADGKADLIWRNSQTGEMSLWLMDGAARTVCTRIDPDSNWLTTVVAGPLELSEFSVSATSYGGIFEYIPHGRLIETTGMSGITTSRIDLTLNDLGTLGNMPPLQIRRPIPAGGSIDLNPFVEGPDYPDDPYDYYYLMYVRGAHSSWFTISISFIDDAGREGVLTARAPVSKAGPLVIDGSWQNQ